MLDSKISIGILVAGLIGLALCFNSKSSEGFWNIPARTIKVERVLSNGPDFFQTPGFQGILSPRFSNTNYGARIQTQLPDYQMFGVPSDPLGGDFGGSFYASNSGPTVVEGFKPYESQDAPSSCSYSNLVSRGPFQRTEGGYGPLDNREFETQRVMMDPHNPSAYANGNYKQVLGSIIPPDVSDGEYSVNEYLNSDGELKQPIIYDRFLYANRHSRLRSQGDPFRGDLPIVPMTGNWFVPNVHPNVDLQAGALNVMGGVNNETNHQLASLIYNSSGGYDSTIGGVDLKPMGGVDGFSRMNMGNQTTGVTVSAGGDVIMTSFP